MNYYLFIKNNGNTEEVFSACIKWRVQGWHLGKGDIANYGQNSGHPRSVLGSFARHGLLEASLVWLDTRDHVGGKIWKCRLRKADAVHFISGEGL